MYTGLTQIANHTRFAVTYGPILLAARGIRLQSKTRCASAVQDLTGSLTFRQDHGTRRWTALPLPTSATRTTQRSGSTQRQGLSRFATPSRTTLA